MNEVVRSFLEYIIGAVFLGLFGLLFFSVSTHHSFANIIEYKDTLGTSVPAATSTHTIQFKTTTAIQPGDYIRFRPDPGAFTIPAIDFGINQVELFVDSGSGYTQRITGTTTSTSTDGVSITTGTSGNVSITLNSTTGIPANSYVRMLVGNHTANSTTTDASPINPSATTSHPIFIEKGGSSDVSVRGWVAIVDQISVGPVDTTESIPPVRFNGAPSGMLSGTTLNVIVSLNTDEFATCRYDTASGTPYASMSGVFTVSGSVIHSFETAVATSTTYNYFVRCIDDESNFNTDDYLISFSIDEPPTGNPGTTGSSTQGNNDGSGSGSGSSGSGSGSSGGNTGSSGSGGSGGGGGGGAGGDSGDEGGGGFETTDDAYPSGDAKVIINGYAFPGKKVVVLVDGTAAETGIAGSDGKFAVTLDAIARGVYSFGIYALDGNNVRSSTFTTTFTVIGGKTSTLSNINIMPSISVNPDPVNPGQTLTVSGYSIPNATITIENEHDKTSASKKSFTASSGSDGKWTLSIDTAGFINGTYKIRARATQTGGVSTGFSDYTFYGVGEAASVLNADLNRDGKVNLIDFSILLFWWGTNGGDSNPPADINRDGNTSLTDFSILLFQWTG